MMRKLKLRSNDFGSVVLLTATMFPNGQPSPHKRQQLAVLTTKSPEFAMLLTLKGYGNPNIDLKPTATSGEKSIDTAAL